MLISSFATSSSNQNDSLNSVKHQIENVSPQLRFAVIKFLKNFCNEGMDEILKMEGKNKVDIGGEEERRRREEGRRVGEGREGEGRMGGEAMK